MLIVNKFIFFGLFFVTLVYGEEDRIAIDINKNDLKDYIVRGKSSDYLMMPKRQLLGIKKINKQDILEIEKINENLRQDVKYKVVVDDKLAITFKINEKKYIQSFDNGQAVIGGYHYKFMPDTKKNRFSLHVQTNTSLNHLFLYEIKEGNELILHSIETRSSLGVSQKVCKVSFGDGKKATEGGYLQLDNTY